MARYAYDRLSAQDATFLWAEAENSPMHIGSVSIFEAGPLRNEEGGIDLATYRRNLESQLHWIPRYRQKITWTPLEEWPVWIDDRHFDLGYHVRHLSLPRPGSLEQLKELASRILARRLDRARPLWEVWVIEGLEGGDQFAVLSKIHHCMIDGAAGADLSQILMSPSASVEIPDPVPYMPRPAPTGRELLLDSIFDRSRLPFDTVRGWIGRPARGTDSLLDDASRRARALADLGRFALRPASQTPLNGELSPHRRFDWLTMPLDDVLELRRALGCSVNDLVLATVTGALRRYLFRRRVDPSKLDFRVAAPVSVRKADDEPRQGNHVSTWIVELPLAEKEVLNQLSAIRARTAELKRSESALGVDTVMKFAEWLPAPVLERGIGLVNGQANSIVTNVPGPAFPLYSVGAPLLGLYPMVPLLPGVGLGIALFSYDGRLCWGFNADYDLVPDLRLFNDDIGVAFEELRSAAVSLFMEERTARSEPEHEPENTVEELDPGAREERSEPVHLAQAAGSKHA